MQIQVSYYYLLSLHFYTMTEDFYNDLKSNTDSMDTSHLSRDQPCYIAE